MQVFTQLKQINKQNKTKEKKKLYSHNDKVDDSGYVWHSWGVGVIYLGYEGLLWGTSVQ